MLRISICDDSPEEIENIIILLSEYSKTYPLRIETYTSSLDFMDVIENESEADIYLLDIIMPYYTGLDLGKTIIERYGNAALIFFTTSTEYALDAYEIDALQYLLKPVNKQSLFKALDRARSLLRKKQKIVMINSKEGLIPIVHREIQFVEYLNHCNYFHILDDTIQSKSHRDSFEQSISELFNDELFIQTHRAFLVNMWHIRRMEHDFFIMSDSSIIPISKNRLKDVRGRYMSFLENGVRTIG
ncbi:MAG: response regulator transcription factor [Spirochaetales bacterium]|nr:response regulator transcription factor [Spirochaetales bacterium]